MAAGRLAVQYAFDAETEPGDDPSDRIHDGGDAGIGRAHQRQSLFDGAHPCLLKMLVRATRAAEPGIVGDVEQIAGPLALRRAAPGKIAS